MTRTFLTWLGIFSICFSLGCANKESEKKKTDEKSENKTAEVQEDFSDLEQQLAGIWVGSAWLEEAKVNAILDGDADQGTKNAFITEAEVFLTTIMAIDFKPDGTMEQHVELTLPNGAEDEMIGVGTWEITGRDGERAVLRMVEVNADGTETESQRLVQFSNNGLQFAIPAPVSESLANCDALIVFDKQVQDRTANAETDTQSK